MDRKQFEHGVVQKIVQQVPYETRKTWTENDLLRWWLAAEREDSNLRLDGCPDHWQEVHAICTYLRLFGERALK